MSNLTLKTLTSGDPTTHLINVAAGDTVYSPGSIVQVVNTTIYAQTAVSIPNNATTYTNIPDLSASITPKKANSRIYVTVRWFGEFAAQTATWNTMWGIKRNTVVVGLNPTAPTGAANGIAMGALSYYSNDANSTPETMSFDYMDSPNSTSLLTYQVCATSASEASTIYTNRTVAAGAGYEYGSSSITLWEIAQ